MRKPLLSFTLILFTLSINGCHKREMIVNPQQQVNRSVMIPTTSIEEPIIQDTMISSPSIEEPMNQSRIISSPSIEEPIIQDTIISSPSIETTPIREIETPPPSTDGASYQLSTVQGESISIQERSNGLVFPEYPNKIILLQVFGQNCHYCLEEMPTLQQLQQQYAGELQIIALQAQDPMSPSTASMLIQQYQMNYPIIDKEEARDLLYFLQQTFEWRGILPYTLLIKNGVTEYPFSGPASYQELNEAIQSLL